MCVFSVPEAGKEGKEEGGRDEGREGKEQRKKKEKVGLELFVHYKHNCKFSGTKIQGRRFLHNDNSIEPGSQMDVF